MAPPVWCFFLALFAHPAGGLIFPRPSPAAGEFAIHKHDRTRCNHRIGAIGLCLHLQYDSDDGDDGVNNNGSPLVEESSINMPQPPKQQQQSYPKLGSNRNDPYSPSQIMSLMGTSPRRIFLSLASSTAIAFAANFFGITSNLLSAFPEDFVEKSGLDSVYPRGDYKRVTVRGSGVTNSLGVASKSNSGKCSFLIPKEWVADTGLALAQAQRQAKALDYSMTPSDRQRRSGSVLPDAAYGPPGRLDDQGLSNGDSNVSVIINTGVQNFSLSSLGSDPKSAAEVMLSSKFSPRKGVPSLVSAVEEQRGENNIPIYQFEYTVDRGERAKALRAISVVAGSHAGDAFVTLTVVSPDEDWEKPLVDERLRRIAESFKLV